MQTDLNSAGEKTNHAGTPTPTWQAHVVGLFLIYVVSLAALSSDAHIWQPGRLLSPDKNANVAEGLRLYATGDVTLSDRLWDTAVIDGRVVNIFPPLVTMVAYVAAWAGFEGLPFTWIALLFVVPLPGVVYALFAVLTRRVTSACLLTFAFVLGTSEFMILQRSLQGGGVYQLNHAVSQLGLAIFLTDYFSRRRWWLGGIGFAIMTASRLTMGVYALPYLWALFRRSDRRANRWCCLAMVVGTVAVLGAFNRARTGSVWDAGYRQIYADRVAASDRLARDGGEALFALRHVPRNLYWMNVGPPDFQTKSGRTRWVLPTESVGIWWTSPILLLLFPEVRRIVRDRNRATMLIAAGVVFSVLMCYHTTGWAQRGYNRFSLDFLLVLLALIAPCLELRAARTFAVACALWSIVYFVWIIE